MAKARRNQIYDAVITRMVQEGLAKKEIEFRMEHEKDTDEELMQYLRLQARALKHTPWPKEIVGWDLITERFGGWLEAVSKAELPMMRTPNTPSKFQLYLDEVEIQKKAYRVKRSEKKAKAAERNKEKIQQRQEREQMKNKKSDSENNPATVYIDND